MNEHLTDLDPRVPVQEAIDWAGGNQAELGRRLGIGRTAISNWLAADREFLPALAAHRYATAYCEDVRKGTSYGGKARR